MNNENKGQIVLFQTEDGQTKLEVQLQDETVWLTIDQMAELFQRNRSTISRHIKRIYDDGELIKDTTCAKFAYVVNRGIRGIIEDELDFYNLDMIISVGYRVHSHRGVQFRMWATAVLKEYLKKGAIAKYYSLFFVSMMIVTGPSLTRETFISAPNSPVGTGFPIASDSFFTKAS